MYDLRRLRAFHAVAQLGSFSAAGLELGYAQSVVSHHVAALEREFGLTLVNRGTRPVSITDAGARLLRHAEAVLGHVAAAEDELRAIAGLQGGTLRVGAFLSACNSFLPAALARFEEEHPEVEVSFEQLEEPAALRRIRSGDLDLAVVWRIPGFPGPAGATDEDGFDQLHLVDDPYLVVLPPKHRLARHRQVRLADLADERFTAPAGRPRAALPGDARPPLRRGRVRAPDPPGRGRHRGPGDHRRRPERGAPVRADDARAATRHRPAPAARHQPVPLDPRDLAARPAGSGGLTDGPVSRRGAEARLGGGD